MKHERARILLSAEMDNELGILQRFALRRHTTRCPSCLAEMEALRSLRTALRTNLAEHRAPPALGARIVSALPEEPAFLPRPQAKVRIGFPMGALAGGIAGIALTLAVTRTPPPPDTLVSDAVADHVRSLMASHLTDVPTSDQHTVKPWLSARLDLSPVVKDFAADGFPLLGGRLDLLDGHRAAAIVYRRDKHIINLFAFVAGKAPNAPPTLRALDGFNVVAWRMDGIAYLAVSDVEAAELMQLVRLIRGN